MNFENLGLNEQLMSAVKRLGFTQPTLIQERSIPSILRGEDVIGESATGSGKTLAFGAGIIQNLEPGHGIQALILTPTRELAEQVCSSLKLFSQGKNMQVISIYGGVSINNQFNELRRADVVVATPGRLLDHLQRRTIELRNVKILVLDEADRMFDMGFIDDVERIIRASPKERQTLFFSATISPRVKDLARKYMINPKIVMATKFVDPSKLRQVYYNISKNMKMSLLVHLIGNEKSDLIMVFCNTRSTTDFVERNLRANGINATAIHGGLSQSRRSKTLETFNNAKATVLVCTDIAARGLHIDNVSHIYNYEIPKDATDYIHRIGRTARAGEEGKVINLLSEDDYGNFSKVMDEHRTFTIDRVDVPEIKKVMVTTGSRDRGDSRGNFRRSNRYGDRRNDNRRDNRRHSGYRR